MTIMKKLNFLIACLLITLTAGSQDYDNEFYTVVAPSGLSLREGPGLEYDRVGAIPFGGRVMPEDEDWRYDQFEYPDTIDERFGFWWLSKTEQGRKGYLFSAYLKNGPLYVPATEVNREYRIEVPGIHCKPLNFDPDLHWYAFQMNTKSGMVSLEAVTPTADFSTAIDMEDLEFAYALSGDYVYLDMGIPQGECAAPLLLGMEEPIDLSSVQTAGYHQGQESYYSFWGRMFFPYETHRLAWDGPASYIMEGEEELQFLTDTPNAPEAQRIYQLNLSYFNGRDREQINLTEALAVEGWGDDTYHLDFLPMDHPRLAWHGDINADGHPDLLFYQPNRSECCGGFQEYYLLVSEEAENLHYRKAAVTRVSPCFGC